MTTSPSPGGRARHEVGATVGKFRLLARAGQGGMGLVWKAEDATLGRTVALKFLPETLAGTPEFRRRFLREARAAGRLSHPGVATVFEAGEVEGQPFIAIEWVDGETVSDLVARGPLPVPDALRIARDAAAALAHAHAHGVLHRDVSARNLMVARDGHVAIVDFGLALPEGTSRITSSSSTLGTMPYLAPEVILGGMSTERSDVYSLAVVLYEMLTGTLPFRGERPEAVLYAAVNEPLEPASRRKADIPDDVERVLEMAMARDPAARHASAEALSAALAALVTGDLRRLPASADRPMSANPSRPAGADAARHASATPATPIAPVAPRYLVVLPFRTVQVGGPADSRRELFALGVTDTVRAQLARYNGVLVVSPGNYSGQGAASDPREIARACGADLVLQGTIQFAADRLRISYSLLDPLQGVQIAGDVLDGAFTEVFLLQDQIARRVAGTLQPGAASVTALPLRTGLEAVAAQERYLQAIGYLQRFDNEAQVDGAIALLGELRESGNDSALIEASLGRAFLYKYQITHDRAWDTRAEEACARALEMDPRSADVHLTLGNVQRVAGRLGDSVRSFRRALKLRPDHPDAIIGLARALESEGKLAEAEQVFLRVMALRPGFWEPYHRLGGLYFSQGRYQQAILLWNKVCELTPDNARAFYNLGGAYFRLERFEEAIAAFNRSIAIRPEASAYSNLGTLHYFLGHWSEAAAMFEKAVALRPQLPRMWGNLGDALRWIPGREAAADSAYDRAIELMRGELEVNPRDAESLGWLAEWMARRGDTRGAIQSVRRALKLAPEDVNLMPRAVNVFHLAGDRGEALTWLARALEAGYGLAEFERDPDLKPLRADLAYASLVERFTAAQSGRAQGSPPHGEPGRSTERGASV
jgi:serine/threonine-protein kinase